MYLPNLSTYDMFLDVQAFVRRGSDLELDIANDSSRAAIISVMFGKTYRHEFEVLILTVF
jgi:hypothetical protein